MAYNNFCPESCPADCTTLLDTVPSVGDCEKVNNEEITELFWSKNPLASGTLTEWNSRLSNTETTNNVIRRLGVSANLPRVDAQFKTSRKGTRVPLEVDRAITFAIEEDSDAFFEWLHGLQCGQSGLFWFRSGKHIYGGNAGIFGSLISSYEINSESELMAHNWQVSFQFKSKCFPNRDLAVI